MAARRAPRAPSGLHRVLVQFAGTRRNARDDAPGVILAKQPLDGGAPADEFVVIARREPDELGVAEGLRARIARTTGDPAESVRVIEIDSWADHWSIAQAADGLKKNSTGAKSGIDRLLELTSARADRRAFYISMASGTPAQWGALAAALVERNERVAFVTVSRAPNDAPTWPVWPPVRLDADRPARSLRGEVRELERLPRGATVLITGPTGTGKSRLARELHDAWTRGISRCPFQAVNCAALPEALVEAELFGAERGAFTDAKEKRTGRFVLANNGTLFLDEFGELPLSIQARLLTAVEPRVGGRGKRSVRPVGAAQDVDFDAWVVLGTNRDLLAAARERAFRVDLLGRVGTHWLMLPPLREARWALPRAYMEQLAEQAERFGVPGFALDYEAHDALFRFAFDPASTWPWNYRDVAQSAARLAFRATGPAARPDREKRPLIGLPVVQEEIARLRAQWAELASSDDEPAALLSPDTGRDIGRLNASEVKLLRAALAEGEYDALDEVSRLEAYFLMTARRATEGRAAAAWRWLKERNAVAPRRPGKNDGDPVSPSDSFMKRWKRFSWRAL